MKKIVLTMIFLTGLLSMDISEAVKLGLENNRNFIELKNQTQAEKKLNIRLAFLRYLENRDNLNVMQKAIEYMLVFKEDNADFIATKKEIEADFLDSKSILELLTNKKIKDINSVVAIDFSKLKKHFLKNSIEVQSLEKELNNEESKETDSTWNFDLSGEVMYGYESAKRSDGRDYKENKVHLGLSLVLSDSSDPKKDTTIEKAKKLRDLENKKIKNEKDIKKQRENYIEALREYKLKKENIKKYNTKSFQTVQKMKEAYIDHLDKNEALYNVYTNYARLLYTIEK